MTSSMVVVVTSRLIHKHAVICTRNAHEEVAAFSSKKDLEVLVVVLVHLHMVGVASIAAHGDIGQFAHEHIFHTGTSNLFLVIEVFRSDESNNGVNEEWMPSTSKSIATSFKSKLVSIPSTIGRKLSAFTGLEVHNVLSSSNAIMKINRLRTNN